MIVPVMASGAGLVSLGTIADGLAINWELTAAAKSRSPAM
jgi:hypothetical protein